LTKNKNKKNEVKIELVSKELNHLAAILQVYAGGFEFYEVKKKKIRYYFSKRKWK
jgi:hypothetical protein